ncbi:MAG: hypothetical protein K0U39_09390 [Alphaproteobacteria bacterium]|nr:hypothetical protein [Alphaproteobacteria bacterium]
MSDRYWLKLNECDPKLLEDARLQLHHAVQLPMRAGKAILPKQPDYSHTSLDFLFDKQAFACHPLNDDGLRVGIILPSLTLFCGDDAFALHSKTRQQATDWLKAQLSNHGFDISKFDKGGFPLPSHALADGAAFDASDEKALQTVSAWFNNAAIALEAAVAKYRHVTPGPAPVTCWPHHFDIASLISFESGDPETAKSVGVGLSPGDESYGQPYFYTNPWPANADMNFPELMAPGHWHTDGFISAVAPAEKCLLTDLTQETIIAYLDDTISKAMGLIGVR